MLNPQVLVVWTLSAGCFAAALFGILSVARAAERRNRHLQRERQTTLVAAWRRYARDGGDPKQVRRQARSAGETMFWSVLEALELDLTRKQWRRLSDTLSRSRAIRDERRLLRTESPWRRELAARRLSFIPSKPVRRALRRALEQGPSSVSFVAVMALARQRDAWALRWIFDHDYYFAARPSRARTAMLRAFGPGATPILAQRLAAGISDLALERAVIERLGAACDMGSAPAIGARLTRPELELRVAAARALGRLRSVAHSDALIAALRDDAWEVRAQAAHALGRIGVSDAVPELAASLTDPSWWVRRHSAYALTRLGVEGTAALRDEALESQDRYAREMAQEALDATQRRPA